MAQQKTQERASVPYIVHEGSLARMERQLKRVWIALITAIVALVACNLAWLSYMLLAAATYMLEHKEQPVSQIMLEGASYDSGTKFSGIIRDKDTSKVLSVFDELTDTLEVLSPKLYAATIDRLSGIR